MHEDSIVRNYYGQYKLRESPFGNFCGEITAHKSINNSTTFKRVKKVKVNFFNYESDKSNKEIYGHQKKVIIHPDYEIWYPNVRPSHPYYGI